MKLSLLVQLCFTALCIERGLGSEESEESEELYEGNNRRGKCYNVLREKTRNCCNKKQLFNPCSAIKCANPKQCVLHHTPAKPPKCEDGDFPLAATCHQPCPPRKCARHCIPTIGINKCSSCFCEVNKTFINPCKKKNACRPNENCVLQDVTCKKSPCYPVKKCRPSCPPKKKCPDNCLPYVDQNGCKRCHCCNACVNTKCPHGQKCILDQPKCYTCPCPAIAKCR